MAKEKAIIIAANLKGDYGPGRNDVGSILAHVAHIEKEGAAFWSIVPQGREREHPFRHSDIKKGYFYNVTDKAITHFFECEYIKSGVEQFDKRSARRFLIEARKDVWKDGRESFYWAKITKIYRMIRSHKLQDFIKVVDNKPLEHVRNYAIVYASKYKHHDSIVSRREIMGDHIADLLVRGEVTEKDIEQLFSYRLAETMQLIERQGSFKRAGRLDLLFKNRRRKFIVYELKKSIAKPDALDQIKRYMRASTKRYGISKRKIEGVILSKSIDLALAELVKRERNISTQTYSFSIDVK